MQKKLHIKKGDTVIAITGEYSGQQGRVIKIFPIKYKAIVEGINIISKHTKPNQKNQQGGIIKKEAPVHLSNLMLIDPKSGEQTRIGRKKDKDGKTVRYSKKSGDIIK